MAKKTSSSDIRQEFERHFTLKSKVARLATELAEAKAELEQFLSGIAGEAPKAEPKTKQGPSPSVPVAAPPAKKLSPLDQKCMDLAHRLPELRAAEVAKQLGCTEGAANQRLSSLCLRGLLVRVTHGNYRLP